MTTTELHIELDLLLQKINSHYNKNILPQEKDVFINKGISRYINTRVSPRSNVKGIGFDNTTKRLEDLNPLVVAISLPVIYDSNSTYIKLPLDFREYINSSINVKCYKTKPLEHLDRYYEIDINKELYNTLNNLQIGISIGDYEYILYDSNKVPKEAYSNEDLYTIPTDFLIKNTIDIMFQKNLKFLKEIYPNISSLEIGYNKATSSFKFRNKESFKLFIVTNNRYIINSKAVVYKTINGSSVLYKEGNLAERDYLRQVLNNSLLSNNSQSIVCHRDKDRIYLHKDKSTFFPIKVELTYIKNPTKVSAILDSNSELKDETLYEILSDVDRNIKGVLSMDAYDKTVSESVLIE